VGAFGSANTPDKNAGSQKNAITLRERRIALANFVAAGFFGRYAGRTSRPLVGAHYAGLDAAFSFRLSGLMRPGRVYDDGLSISDFGDDLYITLRAGQLGIERRGLGDLSKRNILRIWPRWNSAATSVRHAISPRNSRVQQRFP
jgi:hypothetical protein